MLICKGTAVSFEMIDGDDVELPYTTAMLHDETGAVWPAKSVLFAHFRRTGSVIVDADPLIADYFGGLYVARRGELDAPPRALSDWTRVGDVGRIYYLRGGLRAPDYYQHPFKRRRFLFGKAIHVTLYRRGSVWRLELPSDAKVNWRGFVFP